MHEMCEMRTRDYMYNNIFYAKAVEERREIIIKREEATDSIERHNP